MFQEASKEPEEPAKPSADDEAEEKAKAEAAEKEEAEKKVSDSSTEQWEEFAPDEIKAVSMLNRCTCVRSQASALLSE